MKKTVLIVLLACLFCVFAGFALAEDATSVLTAEPWTGSSGTTLVLNADGTAVLKSNMDIEGTWTYEEPVMTFTYELYGTRTFVLTLEQVEGIWQLTNEEGALFMYESVFSEVQNQAGQEAQGYQLALGEPVTLPFVTFTLEKTELADLVGGDKGYFPAPEGYRLFVLKGTIENTYSGELPLSNINVLYTFNGEYNYTGRVEVYNTAGISLKLDPKTKAEIFIFASIPDEMANSIETADVLFSFNDNFVQKPRTVADGSYIFRVTIGAEEAAQAKEGPAFEKIPFEECPVLFTPEGFPSIYQSGHSSSKSNGKLTRISYSYASRKNGADPKELYDNYLAKLQEEGFTLKEESKGTVVSWGGKKVATVTLTDRGVSIDIVPGNENLKGGEGGTPAAAETEEKTYRLNEKIVTNTSEITLEKASVEKAVYSNKTGKGSYHYYESDTGDPYYVASGTFKNTGKKPVDIKNIYAVVIINGEDEYRADVIGVAKNSSDFISDVSPKKSIECVVYSEIPRDVLNSAKSIQVKLGFTDDFAIKFTSSGSLPLFEHCDQTFLINTK